ncbi:helix-turn-helix domain-containing protein [Arthrobacter sp. NPDC058130]|uniref:helix-turn-helix domain-containing protein n=1 Tax=Arthrobacter sp. NPDC058130 TaxID=3346353 RepID=UPI0036E58931
MVAERHHRHLPQPHGVLGERRLGRIAHGSRVAERFNLSRRSLFYFFENKELHLGERIRALRTRKALELLLRADAQRITYAEIAASCGFTNVQSMRRAVKEFTGMNVREIHWSETGVRVALQQLRESLTP